MSESKAAHTPGPWEFRKFVNGSFGIFAKDSVEFICKVEQWSDAVDLADARLIAAAPEMYEALKDCLDRFVAAFPEAKEYDPIKRGYAAIAKAEGEGEGA